MESEEYRKKAYTHTHIHETSDDDDDDDGSDGGDGNNSSISTQKVERIPLYRCGNSKEYQHRTTATATATALSFSIGEYHIAVKTSSFTIIAATVIVIIFSRRLRLPKKLGFGTRYFFYILSVLSFRRRRCRCRCRSSLFSCYFFSLFFSLLVVGWSSHSSISYHPCTTTKILFFSHRHRKTQ